MKVIFVRHAEPEEGGNGELSVNGRKYSEEAGQKIHMVVDGQKCGLFCSYIKRAVETAEIISQAIVAHLDSDSVAGKVLAYDFMDNEEVKELEAFLQEKAKTFSVCVLVTHLEMFRNYLSGFFTKNKIEYDDDYLYDFPRAGILVLDTEAKTFKVLG